MNETYIDTAVIRAACVALMCNDHNVADAIVDLIEIVNTLESDLNEMVKLYLEARGVHASNKA